MRSWDRRVVVVVVFVVIVAVAAVIGKVVTGDEDDRAAPDPGPSASATVDDPEVTGQTDQPAEGREDVEPSASDEPSAEGVPESQVEQASQVASKLIVAYTQYSYTDETQNEWIERAKPYVTTKLHDMWLETFGQDGSSAVWQRIKDAKREARTEVVSAELSSWFDNTADNLTFTVRYNTDVRDVNTDGWTSGTTVGKWVTLARRGDGWTVSQVRSTENRQGNDV